MSALTDRLFFALRPAAATVAAVEALSAQLRAEQGLQGAPLPCAQLHITLHHLGDFSRFPQELAQRAMAAAATLHVAPFELVLDQAISFSRRPPRKQPCVLLAGEPLAPLKAFHAALVAALKAAELYRYASFRPHLTLLYDRRAIAPQPVAPLRWTATEFLLVDSLLGQGRHEVLAAWPLRAA
ncbi:MAG: 2'-5' RNA ligase family protein [Burkholderiaceae bacterium]